MKSAKATRLVFARFLSVMLLTALFTACSSIGPKSINRDQLDYGRSIGQNWKNQLLANLVRLRYVDMPVYLDVGQVVAGYSLETQVSGGLGYGTAFDSSNTASLGAGGRFTDRPTITYTPKTGTDYLTSMLKPIKPSSLLALIQSGYDARLLFTWAVEAINGLRNYSVTAGDKREPDPEFYDFVERLRKLQISGGVAFKQSNDPATNNEVIVFFRDASASEQAKEEGIQARKVIGLSPKREKFRVVYSPFAFEDDVLAIQTRSILQIMIAMAGFVDVPDIKSSEAFVGYIVPSEAQRPFFVHSGLDKPENSFASTLYNGYWYWIDPTDLRSKQVFTLMLYLTTLTDAGGADNIPVLTIPTG
jgi:hypothetical protein